MWFERREFLAIAALAPLIARGWSADEPVRIGILVPRIVVDSGSWARSAMDGVEFGLEEARQTYELLGRTLELAGAMEDAVAVIALIEEPATSGASLLVDARARVPGDPCGGAAFRVGVDAETPADTLLWHPTLHRYGAAQLNERFVRAVGRPMDEHAWAGWFAVKVVAEAALRARSSDPAHLRDWLTRERARFDGHKGQPLRFDADRRLLQPLYRLEDGQPVQLPAVDRHAC